MRAENTMQTVLAAPATAIAPKVEEPKEILYQEFLASPDEKETAEKFDQLAAFIW